MTHIITSDKGGGKCFVRLSVSKIIQEKRARIWMKCCMTTDVGT